MVLKKKVDYGQNGFRVPVIPRGPRSVRRRYPLKRAVENKICAIELLASLAGKLLQESEVSSASSNASQENGRPAFGRDVVRREQDDYRPPKAECVDNASCEESVYVSEAAMHKVNQACGNKESPHDDSDGNMECTSIVSSSDCPDKVHCDAKSVNLESKAVSRYLTCKLEESFPDYSDHFHSNVDKGIEKLGVYKGVSGDLTNSNLYNAEDKMVNTCKNSSKFNPIGIPVPDGSLSRHQNDIRLGSRDDDENFSRFKKASSKFKAFRPGARISNRRIRKLLTSKYWKTAPKLKDSEHSSTVKQRLRNDGAWRVIYNKRKSCYNNEKSKHGSLYKKQKLFDQSSVVISDGGFSGESVSNPPEKNLTGEKNGLAAKFSGVNGVSSSVKGHQSSFHTKSSHVKFRIKSFKVPELYIEVPESATVGSLKRTVMEAVTALFGGGLRIGVHHQGKKVRDDNRTLSQTGITHEENLETLGFALEPNLVQAPSPLRAEKSPSLPYENPQPLNRCAPTPVLDSGISDAPYKAPSLSNACNHDGSYDNSASHHTNMSPEKVVTDSRALVPVSPLSVEALAVVPVNQKTKRSEFSHRRTRRPFSVAEVEALVQAVEKLGTGRWRDVKLHAFEKSDHRTYVDLKDKWKTLVHTANISPQQRRGEPVPQELLDRVLAAQAYWSQHQAKPHGKHQVGTLKNSEVRGDNNGAAGMPLALM